MSKPTKIITNGFWAVAATEISNFASEDGPLGGGEQNGRLRTGLSLTDLAIAVAAVVADERGIALSVKDELVIQHDGAVFFKERDLEY